MRNPLSGVSSCQSAAPRGRRVTIRPVGASGGRTLRPAGQTPTGPSSPGSQGWRVRVIQVADGVLGDDPVWVVVSGSYGIDETAHHPAVFGVERRRSRCRPSTPGPPSADCCTTYAVSATELSFQVSSHRVRSNAARPASLAAWPRHRTHHVHLFVAQDVAVVDVLPAEVDELVDDGRRRVALRVT
jgi:hypothetical protein